MALKKSQLYSSLWQSCDELRGGMDASQYKDYVLTLLFMKYVSDKAASAKGSLIDVPKGASFADMVALKGDKEIGDRINKIIARLAEANDLKGVIDQADFNDEGKLGSGKEMQDRLSKLVAIFEGLDFRANRAEGDDLLGDAYEYLMRHFATESGKSKGQFYTPAEVSRIMAQVIGIERAGELREPTVYDPTCGSGSLLIKAADEAGTSKLAIYGQEMDVATWALARMNMILHGHPTAELWRDNTLSAPHFKNKNGTLRTFDFTVANPPFSAKAWSSGLDPAHDEFGRFEYGIPPAKNGDYAFLLHLVASLKSTGKGAIILPHGVLFRGNREADIRRNLVQRGLIKGIIGLPANLFYGTLRPAAARAGARGRGDQCEGRGAPQEDGASVAMSSDAMEVEEAAPRYVTRTDAQGVPPGYKRTEIGAIPEDWTAKPIRDFAPLQRGFDLPTSRIRPGSHPVVYSNGVLQHHDHAMVKGPGVVTGRSGTIGKVHFVEHDYWPHNTTLWVTTFRGNDPRFVYYIYAQVNLARFLSGSGVPTLNRNDVHQHYVAVPPPPEQRAIAEALSDVDGLLGALEALIAKKRAIKQAAMQQLLTGKTRLPGFSGEWETRRLGSVLSVCHGKSQREVEMPHGPYPILATGGQIGTASRPLYDKPSVLIGRKGTIDQPQYMDRPFWTVDTLFYCAMAADNVAKFFFYRFCLIDWKQYNEASGVPSLNARTIEEISIACPKPAEQSAIATVLSDMDAEIAALEARRDKSRAIKQGMMQQLLTGRVRLVKPETAA